MMKFAYYVQRKNGNVEFFFNENRFRSLLRRARYDSVWVEWAIKRIEDGVILAQSKGYKP